MYSSKSVKSYVSTASPQVFQSRSTICTCATDTNTERLSFCFHQFTVLCFLFYSLFWFFSPTPWNISYHMQQKSVLHAYFGSK